MVMPQHDQTNPNAESDCECGEVDHFSPHVGHYTRFEQCESCAHVQADLKANRDRDYLPWVVL